MSLQTTSTQMKRVLALYYANVVTPALVETFLIDIGSNVAIGIIGNSHVTGSQLAEQFPDVEFIITANGLSPHKKKHQAVSNVSHNHGFLIVYFSLKYLIAFLGQRLSGSHDHCDYA